ncbi:hypothetical protein BOX15_Mlig022942g2 [Macrostomum lignano]|uniref:LIM zinc-binding domain-containing protein n=1 Tax=Macrostomum lignano TaxID=282301 RepID=A0A267E0M9_9PLAT|nr:hypothetical protein BOX15_Mlig022942g2 [Macrostomum lignano]
MEKCQVCKKLLKKSDRYAVKRGRVYCPSCYKILASSKCGGCGKPIFGNKLCAMEKEWHPDHFKCVVCHKMIEDDTFAIFEDQPVCNVCKNSKNPPASAKVKRCKECEQPLLAIKYYVQNGEYYCEPCYEQTGAPKCHECKRPILGKWVTSNGKTWHAEHFCCFKCNDNLMGRPFSFKHGDLMCVPCFKKFVLHRPTEPKPTTDPRSLTGLQSRRRTSRTDGSSAFLIRTFFSLSD